MPLEDDDYLAFGLACCFVMNDNLKLDGKSCVLSCLSGRAADDPLCPVRLKRDTWVLRNQPRRCVHGV